MALSIITSSHKIANDTFQASLAEHIKRVLSKPEPQKEATCCRCSVGNCDDCQCVRQRRLCHSCGSLNCGNKQVCRPYVRCKNIL